MDRLVSDRVIEQLKSVDNYIVNGSYSIVVISISNDILKYVLSLIIKKCVLLDKYDYIILQQVIYDEDLECIGKRLKNGSACILGFKPSIFRSKGLKLFNKTNKYVTIVVDRNGISSDICVGGEYI